MREKLLLLGIAVAISFALAELMLRVAAPELGRPDDRVLLTTEAPIRDDVGAIRYAPHRSVRSVLVYGDEFEIDTRYQTNDVGLVDHRDYLPPATTGSRYAFVGDSYAAGVEGGRPWIPALRDHLGIEAYALGMGATGVLGFERMLHSMSRQLHFTDIVFVAISDDFHRPLWRPLRGDDEFWICADSESDQACAQRPPIAYLMQQDSTDAQLLAQAGEILGARERNRGALRSWLRSSRLLVLARDFAAGQSRAIGRDGILDESLAAVARTRDAYPDARIRFVHVPDKRETARREYDLDLATLLADMRVEYLPVLGRCPWSTQRYLPRDNHPDQAGYEALSVCVAEMLELAPADPSR